MFDKYRLVIFDWDGTLMDSVGRIVSTISLAAQEINIPVPTEQQIRDIIGLSLDKAMAQLFPNIDGTTVDKLSEAYKRQYLAVEHISVPMFPGALNLLAHLRQEGKNVAVATGKGQRGLRKAMESGDAHQYIEYFRTAEDSESKPSPDMINQILDYFNVEKHDAVMVGDSIHDMGMARNAGIDRIAVGFGAHSFEVLQEYQPVALINCYKSLLSK